MKPVWSQVDYAIDIRICEHLLMIGVKFSHVEYLLHCLHPHFRLVANRYYLDLTLFSKPFESGQIGVESNIATTNDSDLNRSCRFQNRFPLSEKVCGNYYECLILAAGTIHLESKA